MDEAQANEINDHLMYVAFTLDEAIAAVSHLSPADQKMLNDPLYELWHSLHSDVLQLVYEQHPSLDRWPRDAPMISCDLRWKEVTLPESISEQDLDAVILSKLKPRSLKVARVVSDVYNVFEERGQPIDSEVVGARIRWLDDVDRRSQMAPQRDRIERLSSAAGNGVDARGILMSLAIPGGFP